MRTRAETNVGANNWWVEGRKLNDHCACFSQSSSHEIYVTEHRTVIMSAKGSAE